MPCPRLAALISSALASLALCAGAAFADDPQLPPTQQALLPAPDPAGPVTRGTFIDDPLGQIERLGALDHLVAWTVRTPADRLRTTNADVDKPLPLTWPERSELVVVDERGGAPLVIDYGARFVRAFSMVHGPTGGPQLAVRHCAPMKGGSCIDELVTLGAGPTPTLLSRADTTLATLVLKGRVDGGRRLIIGKRKRGRCLPSLSLAPLDGGARRALPAIRYRSSLYTCAGLSSVRLFGRFVLATVSGTDRKYDLDGQDVFALDADAGRAARWHHIGTPETSSGGSGGTTSLGPAFSGDALFWTELDTSEFDPTAYNLSRLPLPGGRVGAHGDPVVPTATSACDIAATTDAVYELDNERCVPFATFGKSAAGAIHRLSGKDLGLAVNAPRKPAKQ